MACWRRCITTTSSRTPNTGHNARTIQHQSFPVNAMYRCNVFPRNSSMFHPISSTSSQILLRKASSSLFRTGRTRAKIPFWIVVPAFSHFVLEIYNLHWQLLRGRLLRRAFYGKAMLWPPYRQSMRTIQQLQPSQDCDCAPRTYYAVLTERWLAFIRTTV